jgi:putative tryptophan/tyrosine transport system substrate-binding protein
MKRLILCLALGALFFAPGAVWAKSYVVSVNQIVEHPALDEVRQGFMDHFKQAGLQAEYNVHIAQGNPSTNVQIANQILGEDPDIVLAISTPSAQACAQKIKNIPILATAVTDLVAAGLVKSMDKPGANVTGMTDMSPIARQVELIQEIQPDLKTLGVIYNAGEVNSVTLVNVLKDVCKAKGLELVEAPVVNSSGVFQAAKSLVGRVDAVYVPTDNTVISTLESAAKVSTDNDLPLYCADTNSVSRGAVAALAVDYYRMGVQTGAMAERILLQGAKPANMPVESLQDLELYVNTKSAKEMGVTIPDSVLKRADKVIK